MTVEPWRYACPNDYRDVYRRQAGYWYCNNCNDRYDRVTDLRTDRQVKA